ncbi:MAG: RHS repeat-associated core domain-containing protein [Candidatus Obscuribacter sp.]|nr:RHS repeat-associated core domain-containing protein [Candidatus Obscuribacter sp.]
MSVQILADQSRPLNKYLSLLIANQWLMNQLKGNVVQVSMPDTVLTFTKLPDGTYAAPRTNASELVLASGAYTLTTAQGVEYSFDTDGNIDEIVYPFGVTVSFTYTSGRLTSVSNGMGRTLTLSYTGDRLTSVSDGNGRSVQYSVNGSNELVTFTDANGEDTTYDYNGDGRLTQIFYPANPLVAFVTNTYDSLGRVMEQEDPLGNLYQYFLAGSRAEELDPESNSYVLYFDKFGNDILDVDQLGNETVKEWDGRQRLVKVTSPEGNYSEFEYDDRNNILSITKVAKPGSGLSDIVSEFTWSSTWNKVATFTDPNGNVTSFTYDATTGVLTNVEYPVVNSQTPEIVMTYTARGQVEDITDQEGMVTRFTYDATTEVLETVVRDYGVSKLNLTTVMDYDAVGNLTSITDPNGNEVLREFDDNRQMTKSTAPTPFSFETQFEYDENGNRTALKRETGDVGTPWQIFASTFNAANLVETTTDPLSHVTDLTYDTLRRLSTVEDAESRVTTTEYDELSRVQRIIDAASNDALTAQYTDNGLQDSLEDARTKVTAKTFDGHDRLVTVTYADSTTEEFTYDDNGNILTFQNRAGDEIAFTYDALNRLIEKAPDGQAVVSFEYDLVGRLTQVSTPVVTGNPASGDYDFVYDGAGRLITEELPDSKQVQYELDDNGNVTKITWPDSYYVQREYDELNRLTAVKLNGSGTPALQFDYDDLSRRTKITYGNGVETNYTYNWDDTVESIEHVFSGSSVKFEYGYNNVREVTTQDVDDSTYMWHPASGGTVTYAAAGDVNEYPTVGGVSYAYDDNGCLTDDGTWDFAYDTEQHLLSATDGSTTVDFVYDGQHRQTQKTVGAAKTRFIYSGWQRIADYNGATDALQNRFVYGVGLDEPLIIVSSGGTLTYLHHDKMGSLVATSNSSGVVTNKNKFGPFGEITTLAGTAGFGFTGQRYDSETGLYYYKRRYYSPKIGRFLQPDPIGYRDSLNLYTYAKNNSLQYMDPLGLEASDGFQKWWDSLDPLTQLLLIIAALGGAAAINPALAAAILAAAGLSGCGVQDVNKAQDVSRQDDAKELQKRQDNPTQSDKQTTKGPDGKNQTSGDPQPNQGQQGQGQSQAQGQAQTQSEQQTQYNPTTQRNQTYAPR